MGKLIELPDNLITPDDRIKLESFGGREISLGRITRFHWNDNNVDELSFEMYRGGADEELVFSLHHDRRQHTFIAKDADNREVATGNLNHVMAVLDKILDKEDEEDKPA